MLCSVQIKENRFLRVLVFIRQQRHTLIHVFLQVIFIYVFAQLFHMLETT